MPEGLFPDFILTYLHKAIKILTLAFYESHKKDNFPESLDKGSLTFPEPLG